tara:strand:- start:1801 stop:2415 length:615 start_codon:yes stop_codon:yes gene_type:complete
LVIKVGVLELQGDFELHHRILKNMGVDSSSVKKSSHLDKLDGLIIPGGESTTMSLLIDNFNMHDALVEFGLVNPVMGTCAGLIIMARNVDDARIKPLGLVDIAVKRNAYGRQIRSVTESIQFNFSEMDKRILPTTFIRAPEITNINEDFKIIGTYKESPVAILAGHCLCLTFHPELDQIDIFHKILFDSSSEVYFKKLDQNYAA